MALTSGTKLGPYEIQSSLGAGGMGEVYRARDTRLERTVAVKVLPESLAKDSDRLQRFEQEARVLSTLNHPTLLAIYDVGTQGGTHYLVSEYLEGQTLREQMGAGPLPQRKVCEYALQIANGLAAAHDKGIVHRDLKPENIFVSNDERVKILDFGLAKQSRGVAALTGETATVTSPAPTTAGTVMGTVGYMSPEQVRGQTVDHRSDIFSLGAILYEMASGKRAFKGDSGVETMNAILKDEPPEIDLLQMKVSPGLERVVRHCLEKSPANRFQSAHDLAFALGALSGTDSTAALQSGPVQGKRLWLRWVGAGLALAIVAGAAVLFLFLARQGAPRAERLEFAIPIQEETSYPAISADGRMLAFVLPDEASGANMLGVQRVGSSGVSVLAGTEGASYPFWSPDDAYVAFFADGNLKKIATSGGVPQILASATYGRGGSWGRRGVIIYAPQASGWLWKVNADGSDAGALTDKIFDNAKEASHRWPVFLPDGNHFLFLGGSLTNTPHGDSIYLSSLTGGEKSLVLSIRSNPGYANGYLFYADQKGSLRAIVMDVSKGGTLGESQVVGDQVGFQPSTVWGAFSVAENGTVIYSPTIGAGLSVLTWYDRAGKELGHVGDIGVLANPSLSPEDSRAGVDVVDAKAENVNLWVSDLKHGTSSPFTFDRAEDAASTWSRDGTMVAYRSLQTNYTRIALKEAQGLQSAKVIFEMLGIDDIIPNSWSRDDQEILCTLQPAAGGSQLVLLPRAGGKLAPFLPTKTENSGQISPDGKWVAYASHESGDWEIYVTTFPSAAGKWQVSRGGGIEPRWRGDGKEIFYIGARSTLTAVPVVTEGAFSSGNPTALFQSRLRAPVSSTDLFTYDVTKDGQRFLVNRYVKPQQVSPLHIVLNATAELKK
ncbi:MAG: protein kinase [Candidatus Acidiferrales bacterium]